MQKLRFVNADGTVIDLTDGNYGVVDWSGLSDSEIDIQSQQVPFHDGSVFLDALIKERTISVTVAVNDFGSLEERYRLRRELIKALNPKNGEGYLYYKNDFIEKRIGAIAELPSFSNKNQNDSGTLKASLTFNCLSPLWEDVEETVVDLNIGENVTIENEGDVDTNVKIEFLTNQVENPRIENLTTGQKISVEGSFSEEIRVDTSFGKKTIEQVEEELKIKSILGETIFFTSSEEMFLICKKTSDIYYTISGKSSENLKLIDYNKLRFVYYSKYYDKFFLSGSYSQDYDFDFPWEFINDIKAMSEYENILCGITSKGFCISTDGINFTRYDIHSSSSDEFKVITDEYSGKFFTTFDKKLYRISTDGTYQEYSSQKKLYGLTYSYRKISQSREILIGSETGIIYISRGGDIVDSVQLDTTENITSVFYNDKLGIYFACGANNTLFDSYDGIIWNKIETGLRNNANLKILGSSDILGSIVISSNLSDFIYSWDGVNFESYYKNGLPDTIVEIKFISEKNIWLAYSGNYLCVSEDGVEWTIVRQTNFKPYCKSSLCYFPDEDIIIALERSGSYIHSIVSEDGFNWTQSSENLTNYITALSYIPNLHKIHAYGLSGVISSSDGLSWQSVSIGTQPIVSMWSKKYNKIIYGSIGKIYFSENETSYDKEVILSSEQNDRVFNIVEINDSVFVLSEGEIYINPEYDTTGEVWIIIGSSPAVPYNVSDLVFSENKKSIYTLDNQNKVKILISKNISNSISKTDRIEYFYYDIDEELNFYGALISQIIDGEKTNIIDKVTSDSDMNLKLAPGKNVLRIDYDSGDMSAKVVYRQKYVGV